jgi:uncharacterized iron-regulated membrane protein
MLVAATLAGGSWIFLTVVVVLFFAVVFGYYTRRGSAINLRPWHERGSSAEGQPPSLTHDESQDVRNWTRGTQPPRRSARAARRKAAAQDSGTPADSQSAQPPLRPKGRQP